MIGGIIQRENGNEMFENVAGVRCSTQSILRRSVLRGSVLRGPS